MEQGLKAILIGIVGLALAACGRGLESEFQNVPNSYGQMVPVETSVLPSVPRIQEAPAMPNKPEVPTKANAPELPVEAEQPPTAPLASNTIRAIHVSRVGRNIVVQSVLKLGDRAAFVVTNEIVVGEDRKALHVADDKKVFVNIQNGETSQNQNGWNQLMRVGCLEECAEIHVQISVGAAGAPNPVGAWYKLVEDESKLMTVVESSIPERERKEFDSAIQELRKNKN